jgi:hypothetical protein
VDAARHERPGNRACQSGCAALLGAAADLCILSALLCCSTARAQVSVQMTADRDRITIDEVVTVHIKIEAAGVGSPDEELPSFDGFEVVRRSVSRPMQFSFSFGTRGAQRVVRSSTEYTLVLRPLAEGRFQIPPVVARADGKTYQSRPLTITVEGGGAASTPQPGPLPAAPQPEPAQTGEDDPRAIPIEGGRFDQQAFLRTVADKAEAYPGEQVTVTIYLYLRGRLRSVPSVETEPSTDGFWVRDLLPPNRKLQARRQVVGGMAFGVYTLRRFAAFALREGDLSIGPMTVKIEQGAMLFDPFDIFNQRSLPDLRRTGVPLSIRIEPLPDEGRPPGEIAVGRFQLEAKLDRDRVKTGDAVTLTATVRGQGNLSTVRLQAPEMDGLQVLQPEIRDLIESPGDRVSGTRVFEWLLVPLRPGRYAVGPLQLPTFDPATGSYASARSAPLELNAVGKSVQTAEEAAVSEEQEASEEPEKPAFRFGPVRTSSSLRRETGRVLTSSWYPWLAALGPLGWLLVLSISAVRRRLEQSSQKAAPRRALGQAERRLRAAVSRAERTESAEFYAELSSALKAVLEARLGEPVGGFTHPELREHLRRRGMSAGLAGRVVEELGHCEMTRFSPAGASVEERKRCGERSRQLFRELARFSPVEQEQKR